MAEIVPYAFNKWKRGLTMRERRMLHRSLSSVDKRKNAVHRLAKQHIVCNTETLVRVFNSPSTHPHHRELLFQWLDRYHKAFVDEMENLTPEVVREYAELVKIDIYRKHHKDFQLKVLKNLADIFSPKEEENDKANVYAKILNGALQNMDRHSLLDAAEALHSLAYKLIQCIPADLKASDRDFHTRGYIFEALHQTLDLLFAALRFHDRPLDRFDNGTKIRRKCAELKANERCYRTWYFLKVIEQDIGRLNRTKLHKDKADFCAFVGKVFCGVLHCYHGFRQVLDIDVDIETLQKGRNAFNEAAEHLEIRVEKWYGPIQELAERCRAATHQNADIEKFREAYDDALLRQNECQTRFEAKAFLFGQILILRSYARSSESAEIQKDAVNKLIELSKASNDRWVKNNADILQAFLEAFHVACARDEYREQVYQRLTEIQQLIEQGSDVHQRFENWKSNKSIKEKLCTHEPTSEIVDDVLFQATRTDAGHLLTVSQMEAHDNYLRGKYRNDHFSKVSFFDDPFMPKPVKDMRFVMRNRKKDNESTDATGNAGTEPVDTDDASVEFQEKDIASGLLDTDDFFQFFQSQEETSDSKKKAGESVLLIGRPGTGKTCFARSIVCQWADNHGYNEFEAVYFISVKKLDDELGYNETEYQGDNSLERVIAKVWFNCEDSYSSPTITQIKQDLDSPKTLVIFDGVDEGKKLANNLLSEVFRRRCKSLLTSRPGNLQHVLGHVNHIAECSGFSDLHLLEFIHSEIGAEGPELVKLLYPHPHLWEVTHIPMIANILCHLWRDRRELPAKREITKSPWHLCERMTRMVWDHLAGSCDRLCGENIKDAFDTMAQIAFDALKDDKKLIQKKEFDRASKSIDEWSLGHCGFLVQEIGSKDYCFLHPVFWEYFAGRHLAKTRKQPNKCRYSTRKVKAFLSKGEYTQKQKNAIAFMVEEFVQEKVFDDFLELVDFMDSKPPKNVTSEQRLFAKLHLLNALLSSCEASLMEELDESDFAKNLLKSLSEMITDHFKDANKSEQLLSQLGQIPNVLHKYPDLVMEISKIIEQDPSPSSTPLQYFVQIAAHVPEAEEWVRKILEKQISHSNDDARAQAVENIANVLAVSSDKLEVDLKKLLEKESSKSESAATYLETFNGTDPFAMQSQLKLLERQRKILTGNAFSAAME